MYLPIELGIAYLLLNKHLKQDCCNVPDAARLDRLLLWIRSARKVCEREMMNMVSVGRSGTAC